jgi:hypothetical protein
VFTCWLVAACVTPLTPKAKSVKEMRTDWVSQNDCEFLTKELVESVWKFGASGNYKQVRNKCVLKQQNLGVMCLLLTTYLAMVRATIQRPLLFINAPRIINLLSVLIVELVTFKVSIDACSHH